MVKVGRLNLDASTPDKRLVLAHQLTLAAQRPKVLLVRVNDA